MPFGLRTWVSPKKHVLDGGAHWRHLANTIEQYMCGSNAAFLSNYFNDLLTMLLIVEPITLEMAVVNPLKVALVLQDLTLLWQFVPLTSDGLELSADKLDPDARPVSYSNENDFGVVSAVLCCVLYSCHDV